MLFPEHSPWHVGQLALFDRYQRVFPRQASTQPVVIVEIDEASLQKVGQWPWPRNRTAELIEAIAAHRPLAFGLDIYMPEADQTSPEPVAANLPPSEADLAQRLRALPRHEQRLARALASAPSVLGVAGFDFATASTVSGVRTRALRIDGGDALPYLRHYPYVLASLPELQAAARGQGMLSIDLEAGVVRRVPLVAAINDQPVASLEMEMLRVATDSDAVEIEVGRRGIDAVRVATAMFPPPTCWRGKSPASASRTSWCWWGRPVPV